MKTQLSFLFSITRKKPASSSEQKAFLKFVKFTFKRLNRTWEKGLLHLVYPKDVRGSFDKERRKLLPNSISYAGCFSLFISLYERNYFYTLFWDLRMPVLHEQIHILLPLLVEPERLHEHHSHKQHDDEPLKIHLLRCALANDLPDSSHQRWHPD